MVKWKLELTLSSISVYVSCQTILSLFVGRLSILWHFSTIGLNGPKMTQSWISTTRSRNQPPPRSPKFVRTNAIILTEHIDSVVEIDQYRASNIHMGGSSIFDWGEGPPIWKILTTKKTTLFAVFDVDNEYFEEITVGSNILAKTQGEVGGWVQPLAWVKK